VTHAVHGFLSHFQTRIQTQVRVLVHVHTHTHTHTHAWLATQVKNLWTFFRSLQETHGSHKLQIGTTKIPCDSEWATVEQELKLHTAVWT